MASPHVPPQTGSATQPAPSTQPTPDPLTAAYHLGAFQQPDGDGEQIRRTTYGSQGAYARQSAAVSGEDSRRYLTLYFSEVTGVIHGPMHFAPDERVEQIQQWLEEDTFRSRCVDEETNEWLAHAEISTSCGMVLDQCRNLDDYPVCDGDTLTVIVVPDDVLSELEADEQTEERRLQALRAA